MDPIRTLLDQTAPLAAPILPPELQRLYDGDLTFPSATDGRPYVIGNFVSTIDGIVSFRIPGKSGGGDISGNNASDRFVMGLLRASADAVLIGAGTLHATAAEHVWTAESIYPDAARFYQDYRQGVLRKPKQPVTVIVSASGVVDLDRPMFRAPGIRIRILTTLKGLDRLHAAGVDQFPNTETATLGESEGILTPAAMLHDLQAACGVRLLLHEGGPTLFGEFVGSGLVNECFLTLAPQLAGCNLVKPRPTMVWGREFTPETAPWLRLLSLKQSRDHLFLRYGLRA
ncbi:MAG TPA: RibD family protein [Bryobacteraceae bacterium]|jgi:riboflavin biosynthesis pyrimidine reductase